MNYANLSEQELIAAAKQGDQTAFEMLIHLYEKKVFAFIKRIYYEL